MKQSETITVRDPVVQHYGVELADLIKSAYAKVIIIIT